MFTEVIHLKETVIKKQNRTLEYKLYSILPVVLLLSSFFFHVSASFLPLYIYPHSNNLFLSSQLLQLSFSFFLQQLCDLTNGNRSTLVSQRETA